MTDEENLVTVHKTNDPTEAELIKNLLVAEDIPCSLDGEHQAGFTGFFPIGVLVFEGDVERAELVLEQHHVDSKKDEEP